MLRTMSYLDVFGEEKEEEEEEEKFLDLIETAIVLRFCFLEKATVNQMTVCWN